MAVVRFQLVDFSPELFLSTQACVLLSQTFVPYGVLSTRSCVPLIHLCVLLIHSCVLSTRSCVVLSIHFSVFLFFLCFLYFLSFFFYTLFFLSYLFALFLFF